MSQCVEISSTAAISNPEPFLTRCLKAGVITLTLCTQGIDTLKMQAFPVNGKSVVCWNGLIFGAAPVPLAVVPVFVVTRANTGFGLAEGAAVFLPDPPFAIGGLTILVHSQPGLTDRITGRKRFRGFRAAWIEGDKCLALIDCFYGIVDAFHIVALVGKEGTLFQRNRLIRGREDVNSNCGIHDVGWGGQFKERKAGDAVHQHMAFVTPVELIPPLIVLVGSRMDTQGAIRVAFRVVLLGELAFCKGFWVVLLRVCHDGRGIQTNK